MKSCYVQARSALVFILLAVIVCLLSGFPGQAGELRVNYTQQIVQDVHYFYLLQIGDSVRLPGEAWLESSIGFGNLIDAGHSVFAFDLSVYKKLTDYPNYALGIGYSYLYDRKSYFHQQGGKLKEHELTFKLLGMTHFGKTGVSAEFSYTPLGSYKYMNDSHRPLSAFRFGLSALTPLNKHWNLSFQAEQGSQSYMLNTVSSASYRLGLAYCFN